MDPSLLTPIITQTEGIKGVIKQKAEDFIVGEISRDPFRLALPMPWSILMLSAWVVFHSRVLDSPDVIV